MAQELVLAEAELQAVLELEVQEMGLNLAEVLVVLEEAEVQEMVALE